MKKSILILATILLISCHKETAKPATPNQNNPIVSNINSYETPMIGNWKLSKYEYWTNNVGYPQYKTDTVNCKLILKVDKTSLNGLGCNPFAGTWKTDDGIYLDLGGPLFKIVKITPDSLILSNGDLTSSTGGSKYHLWK